MANTNEYPKALSREDAETVEGVVLNGTYVKGLADKHFEIIGKPQYETGPDMDNPAVMKRKLVMKIKLTDGTTQDYYPNKTSRTKLINKLGPHPPAWAGYKGEFIIAEQMIDNTLRPVIYIKD